MFNLHHLHAAVENRQSPEEIRSSSIPSKDHRNQLGQPSAPSDPTSKMILSGPFETIQPETSPGFPIYIPPCSSYMYPNGLQIGIQEVPRILCPLYAAEERRNSTSLMLLEQPIRPYYER